MYYRTKGINGCKEHIQEGRTCRLRDPQGRVGMEGTIKRGRDVRKMDKPYTGREVVHTCSNGWTIERVIPAEYAMEGFFMGHCLGSSHGGSDEVLSLREPDGTPHVTIVNGCMTGRCNQAPKAKYAALCHEFNSSWHNTSSTEYQRWWSKTHRPDVQPEV